MDLNWFQVGPIPQNVMTGSYNYGLVALSYVIAVLASYVALDLAARLRAETNHRIQIYWLLGGAFAMGAGIWSMHFIGMLAFIMPMPMGYEFSWTSTSLLVAILASGLALFILKNKDRPIIHMVIGGIFIGLGIASMHYMGMQGMTDHVHIRYLPGLFFLSILIAIFASEAALWLVLQSSHGSFSRQFYLKVVSALVMGAAICGMHYTGMAAAIFTPLANPGTHATIINPYLLAFLIAGITALIIVIALVVSIYYQQLETAIQTEKNFLNAMLNNLVDGILACDADGNVTVCNKALGNYCKIAKHYSYLALDQFFQLKLINDKIALSPTENPMYKALHGEYIKAKEYIMCLPDKTNRNVVIDGQPIVNADGKKLGAVIVIHDVTSLKQTEQLKKEFVSIVSHELRTPLTSIRGALGLLLGETAGQLPEKMSNLLQIANNNTERLIRLINDILDIEKIEAGKMNFSFKNLDISKLIQDAITEVKAAAENAQVHLLYDYGSQEIVQGDYDRLVQVMVNLLANAIHFSSPGQTVTVKVMPYPHTTRISVIDQGSGIPEEFHNQIFQKFCQADTSTTRRKGGSGLGLSICKAIIERHEGVIHFETSPQGTCFYFDLPNVQVESEIDTAPPLKRTYKNILICDSNPDSAALLQKFLIANNYAADIALTVAQARKLLLEKQYDVIAMDLILQDYDGIKFIQELRKDPKTADIPIIVVSTQVSKGKQILKASGFPLIDWIQKPIRQEQLDKVSEYIQSHFTHRLARILCVEDDPDISLLIQELLNKDAEVFTVKTFEAARAKLNKEPFDLIVLDLRLPDGMGTDLLPCVNCETREIIPIIVFSAYELDRKYAHLVKQALIKTQVSNERLSSIIHSMLRNPEIETKEEEKS